jgi:hypothetical protein
MSLRPEEHWAAIMIAAAIGGDVRQHDDGSADGQYDLDIFRPGKAPAAAELVSAADRDSIELWKLMNGGDGRWLDPALRGGWLVTVTPTARAKRLRAELPGLLAELEAAGIAAWRTTPWSEDQLDRRAEELQITSSYQSDTHFAGSIYITIELPAERSGGAVPDTGDELAKWVGAFLHDPAVADVRLKLARSGAEERHAVVILPGFSTAPFPVVDILMRGGAPLPTRAPDLPDEISHVWAVSSWTSGDGMRWGPDIGWTRFAKSLGEGSSDAG